MATQLPRETCIGVLGDGQLGRMLITNGIAPLGYRAAVLGPGGRNSPAGQVAWWVESWGKDPNTVSDELLREFCSRVSVVLIEWENVPCSLVDRITAMGVRVCPGSNVLGIAQQRLREKELARSLGIRVPNFRQVGGLTDYYPGADEVVKVPSILKTNRDGYDGKGQIHLAAGDRLLPAWEKLKAEFNQDICILEEKITFLGEMSVIVARSKEWMVTYGPFENKHENGILRSTTYPTRETTFGPWTKMIRPRAVGAACKIAQHLGVHGLLVVEFFVDRDGSLVFNEMASRPHNTGHGTMKWCETDQFEQYVRASCNLPYGNCTPHYQGGVMHNVLGSEILDEASFLADGSFVKYGKLGHPDGRKMAHKTTTRLFVRR
ncbi:MAG TPA: ATP-grasp domain-containing protein [Candidatus Paceibacterota bacterium]|nr:ATP-grasp domain-containing protein [Candidatus Paceibacterota bacterium]